MTDFETRNKVLSELCIELQSQLTKKDKQIEELKVRIEKQNTDILTLKGLTERQRAQIEKMKNWCNCGIFNDCVVKLAEEGKGIKEKDCHTCKDWKLKE